MCAHLRLLLFAPLLILDLCTSARAVVLESQVLMTRESATSYGFTIYQEPLNPNGWTDYTMIVLDHRYGSLTITGWALDESSDWYLVPAGSEFSAKTISEGGFTIMLRVGGPAGLNLISQTIAIPSGSFYLGVNTGKSFEPNGQP